MPPDQHTIYVSYADADEEWVVHFIDNLKVYLRKQVGEIDENFIWARYMLRGTDNKETDPRQHLKNSKYLLVILSNAYLNTDVKKEIGSFKAKKNFIVVEHDKIERPSPLSTMKGYHFWDSDEKERVVRWGTPAVPNDITHHRYHQLLEQMARDIVERMNNEEATVFLARTNKYPKERNNLRSHLIKQGFSILPQERCSNSDYSQLRSDIKKSNFFIQLVDNEDVSKKQCEIAKGAGLPILRWAENQQELNSDCPTAICTDIAAFKLEISHWIAKHKDNPTMQASSNTQSSQQIFIYTTEKDRALAIEVQQQLLKHGMDSLLSPSQKLGLSPQEIEESIEQDLLNCQHVIIISDKAPPMWVKQKILHCFKIQAERNSNGNKNNMNVVAVFNKPPPEGLEAKLGIKRANLHIWDCLEVIDNCMSEFKKVILS